MHKGQIGSHRLPRLDVTVRRRDKVAKDGHAAGLSRVLEQHDVADELVVEAGADGGRRVPDALDEAILEPGAVRRGESAGLSAAQSTVGSSSRDERPGPHLGADSLTIALRTAGVTATRRVVGETTKLRRFKSACSLDRPKRTKPTTASAASDLRGMSSGNRSLRFLSVGSGSEDQWRVARP